MSSSEEEEMGMEGEGEEGEGEERENKKEMAETCSEGMDLESSKSKKKEKNELTPGVVYLSRIPPFMRPRKVRHLLSQFGSIGRIYLQPEGRPLVMRSLHVPMTSLQTQSFTRGGKSSRRTEGEITPRGGWSLWTSESPRQQRWH